MFLSQEGMIQVEDSFWGLVDVTGFEPATLNMPC
jgi:hypothetical protein